MPLFLNIIFLSVPHRALHPIVIISDVKSMPSRTIKFLGGFKLICAYAVSEDQQSKNSPQKALCLSLCRRIKTNPFVQNQIILSTNIDVLRTKLIFHIISMSLIHILWILSTIGFSFLYQLKRSSFLKNQKPFTHKVFLKKIQSLQLYYYKRRAG